MALHHDLLDGDAGGRGLIGDLGDEHVDGGVGGLLEGLLVAGEGDGTERGDGDRWGPDVDGLQRGAAASGLADGPGERVAPSVGAVDADDDVVACHAHSLARRRVLTRAEGRGVADGP